MIWRPTLAQAKQMLDLAFHYLKLKSALRDHRSEGSILKRLKHIKEPLYEIIPIGMKVSIWSILISHGQDGTIRISTCRNISKESEIGSDWDRSIISEVLY